MNWRVLTFLALFISQAHAQVANNLQFNNIPSLSVVGNVAITGGGFSQVDLQTIVPVNGIWLSNAGAAIRNCPLIGCFGGDHQLSSGYVKSSAQQDGTIAEYMFTIDSLLNSGKAQQWAISTGYSQGQLIDDIASGNMYVQNSGGACTSASSGTGPSGTGSGIADNTCSWNYKANNFSSAKVGFFNSAVTGSNGSPQSWGMANDFVIGTGDIGAFKIGAEFDLTNNAADCVVGVRNCFNVFLSGNTFNPMTAELGIGTVSGNLTLAAHYGLFISGLLIADLADIEVDDTATDAICVSCLFTGKVHTHSFKDMSASTIGAYFNGTYSTAAIQDNSLTGTGTGLQLIGVYTNQAELVSTGPVGIAVNGTHSSSSYNDTATSPAGLNMGGTYSLAAIYIPSTSATSIAINSGSSICLNGLSNCFKWDGTYTAFTNPVKSSGDYTTATHYLDTSAVPTISSCGTSPPAATAGSSNASGQFTTGTATPTTCTVTFATAYPTTAWCTISPAISTAAVTGVYISAQSKTAFTITQPALSSTKYNYTCSGN